MSTDLIWPHLLRFGMTVRGGHGGGGNEHFEVN